MDRNETQLHERLDLSADDQTVQTAAPRASAARAPSGGRSVQSRAAATSARPAPAAPARTAPSGPIGEFHPPVRRHQRGLASRSWIPVALSFGTALLVAIALVIYFSQHS